MAIGPDKAVGLVFMDAGLIGSWFRLAYSQGDLIWGESCDSAAAGDLILSLEGRAGCILFIFIKIHIHCESETLNMFNITVTPLLLMSH